MMGVLSPAKPDHSIDPGKQNGAALNRISFLALLSITLCLIPLAQSGNAEVLELAVFLLLCSLGVCFGITLGNGDLFNPFYATLVLYALYAGSAISEVVINHPGSFSQSVVRTYYFATLLGLAGIVAGHRYASRAKAPRFASGIFDRPLSLDSRRFAVAIAIAALMLILFQLPHLRGMLDWNNIRPYTVTALESRVQFRGDSWSGIRSYAGGLTANLLFGAALFFVTRKNSWALKGIIILGLSFFLIMTVMAGQKRELICASFLCLLYIHYRVRTVRLLHIAAPLLFLYVFAVMISHVRFTASIPEMTSAGISMVRENPELLLPMNAGELSGPPLTLLEFISAEAQGQISVSWGRTILSEISVWIPRVIFPDRPLPLSEQYMLLFFPDEYARGAGHGFFIPTEGYWAFGLFGVFLLMFGYGAIISALYRVFQVNRDNNVVWLIYGIVAFTMVFTGIRTGLFGTLRASLMEAMPFMVLAWLSAKRREGVRGVLA